MTTKKPCKHGVILPKGLKCDRGYLLIRVSHNKGTIHRGCGPHTVGNEIDALQKLQDMRRVQRVDISTNLFGPKSSCSKTSYQRLRERMIKELGGCCKCCAETIPFFLTLDHRNNDGYQERKRLGGSSKSVLYLAAKRKFDPTIYQLLCMQCNWGRARNGGICPHQFRLAA